MEIISVGIASHEEIKKRTIAIAKGELRPDLDDPKIWVTSPSFLENAAAKDARIADLEAENERLKRFSREIISGDGSPDTWFSEWDGNCIQDLAENCELIKPLIAKQEHLYPNAEFEVGDKIFEFTKYAALNPKDPS